MTNPDEAFRSVTGLPETAAPVRAAENGGPSGTTTNTTAAQSPALTPAQAGARTPTTSLPGSSRVSAPPSATTSPMSSRDTSPARPPRQQQQPATPAMSGPVRKVARSRKNSNQDVSPHRPTPLSGTATTPSAAAIQRALASANPPLLQSPAAPEPARVPRPSKSGSGDNTPHWPVSPRLKSPPPPPPPSSSSSSNKPRSRRNSLRSSQMPSQPRRPDAPQQTHSAPPIVLERTATPPTPRQPKNERPVSDPEDQDTMTRKASIRASSGAAPALETVQESSLPTTPGFEMLNGPNYNPSAKSSSDDTVVGVPTDTTKDQTPKARESGSDSGGNKHEERGRRKEQKKTNNTSRPSAPSRNSFQGLVPGKSRSVTEPSKNMTVETETVRSVPQGVMGAAQGGAAPGRGEPSGTLRLKASNETIRPRKDKRRTVRKAPSITSGTASSKADIFEAKVASAVNETNSSDSDETFVYESNPPDSQPRPSRHHSRTPSATSMASFVEHPRGGLRSINNVLEGHRSVAGKRSMKFANNPYTSNPDDDLNDRYDGTIRGNPSARPSGSHSNYHHHIGRYGRNAAVNSLFDDGPAPPTHRARSVSGYNSRHGSAPSSPKFPAYSSRTSNPASRKMGELSGYDLDGDGADDERTPLMGTVRTPRSRPMRTRPNSSLRHYEHYERRNGGCLRRFAGCFVLTIMVLLLVFGAVGFLFATTKPLYHVNIREIQNVLASEQEIMLDLLVEAINPNIVAVTIADMDVNIFAKSKHVGPDGFWREHPDVGILGPILQSRSGRRRRQNPSSTPDAKTLPHDTNAEPSFDTRDDDPHDPIEDPEGDSQTMLLGRIFHFDSPLNFDGDPLKRRAHYSIGELRLQKPGNKTEAGGTERWERVIQYPFELIVRGILRYQLPLSSSTHTAPIGASVIVHPEKGVNEEGAMWVEQVRKEDGYYHEGKEEEQEEEEQEEEEEEE